MLERYDGKLIRITTEDGDVFTDEAESLPSGYGLVEFDRAEESIRIDDVQIFHSEIRKIEVLSGSPAPAPAQDRYDDLMGRLLEGPYQIADILIMCSAKTSGSGLRSQLSQESKVTSISS